MEYISFASRAKDLKIKQNRTNSDIARACNLSESMVSRYLSGEAVPSYDKAQDIFRFLGAYDDGADYQPPKQAMSSGMAELKSVYDERILDLKEHIAEYKAQAIQERLERQRTLCIAVSLGVSFIAIFLTDIINGSVGWFRHDGEASPVLSAAVLVASAAAIVLTNIYGKHKKHAIVSDPGTAK